MYILSVATDKKIIVQLERKKNRKARKKKRVSRPKKSLDCIHFKGK